MHEPHARDEALFSLSSGAATAPECGSSQLEATYLRFAPLLRKVAVRKFHIPAGEVESLVHDVFATYIVKAENVEAPERYLIGAICNAARDYLRRSNARDELFCGEIPCSAVPDDTLLDEVERKLVIGRILSRIGARCRDLLYRYYVNGETTDAIAGDLQFTPNSVRVFLSKCRKRAALAYNDIDGASRR